MKSKVYFCDLRTTYKENLPEKIGRLLDTAGLSEVITQRDLVAVKLHFGELGNTAFIRPVFIKKIVESIKSHGSIPFLTDCNTLYAGTRSDAPNHHKTAISNGFAYSVVKAPVIIADGLRGQSEIAVTINQKHFKKVYIGSEIIHADSLLSVAHFKGHELSGFGGTIKNLGMGCASRRGKLAQHSTVAPKVKRKKCKGCGDCIPHCPQQAISLIKEKAVIDPKKCIGCGECIIMCPNGAIQIQWNQDIPIFMENMVEYTMGVLQNKKDRALFLNFIIDVSPACDCIAHNDAPIVRDIGIVASKDPVAIDQASVDLVNIEHALPGSCLKTNIKSGEDKFRGIYPEIDWKIQLEYAEKTGLGNRDYELVAI
ncbi:MAG: DUF362 domain-containing protein [Deltaproteobacteria bacterium]|nr:DUF362 domain-containing protein [Deltaproteobacteria bacterium]MBW2662168.1 DUF362 domain-containing protein [Deltaproteobacteria bacterium]